MKSIIEQAKALHAAIQTMARTAPSSVLLTVPNAFDVWVEGTAYVVDDVCRYNDTLYRCVQANTSQADWTPDTTPALWVIMDDPSVEWPEWRQPTGAHDAYTLGAKVSHNGKHWISTVDANVWEPGTYGWTEQVEA